VAEDDDRETVGFIAGGRERSDDPIYRGSVSMLYLLESHQRMGLGRQLMRAAALQLAECDIHSLRVWVREGNSARHFYEALGGRYIRAKRLDLAGMLPDIREHVIVTEFLFGWEDTGPLLRCAPLAEGQGNQPDIYPYVRRP